MLRDVCPELASIAMSLLSAIGGVLACQSAATPYLLLGPVASGIGGGDRAREPAARAAGAGERGARWAEVLMSRLAGLVLGNLVIRHHDRGGLG